MDIPYTTMSNPVLTLEPLARAHAEGLRKACAADPDIWHNLYPYSMLDEHFDPNFQSFIDRAAAGLMQPYAVMVSGQCMGITCYYALDRANRVLEIGGTYYHPAMRGGNVNPAAKKLMLARAFDHGARRAVFRVDALNNRSRAAVLKLGAVQEGMMREDQITWTGRLRTTVIFSILDREWPAVCAGLDARLMLAQ